LFEVNVSPFRSFKEVLRGDFLQTRVFGAQNQSDCRNAEKAIEQCWQYGGVVSCSVSFELNDAVFNANDNWIGRFLIDN
jgi:hypothetical protein